MDNYIKGKKIKNWEISGKDWTYRDYIKSEIKRYKIELEVAKGNKNKVKINFWNNAIIEGKEILDSIVD